MSNPFNNTLIYLIEKFAVCSSRSASARSCRSIFWSKQKSKASMTLNQPQLRQAHLLDKQLLSLCAALARAQDLLRHYRI